MKLSFQPDDLLSTQREFEIVQAKDDVFGKPVRKPQDPPIKSLLAFEEELNYPIKENEKQKWISEAKDEYRGYFFNAADRNYYRLKAETASTYLNYQINEPKQEEIQEDNQEEEKVAAKEVKQTDTAEEKPKETPKQTSKKPQQKAIIKSQVNKPKPAQQQKPKESAPKRPLSASKSTNSLQRPASSGKVINNDDGRKERQDARIKQLNQTTRWLPNSAFTTYFGKPAFANYGQGNVNPVKGGYLYGDYMKTYNIAPHEGLNNPEYAQVYKNTEMRGLMKKPRSPEPPRKCKDEDRLSQEQVAELKRRSEIIAELKNTPSKRIIKPNLYEVKTFKSVHSTPNSSFEEDKKDEEEEEEVLDTVKSGSVRKEKTKVERQSSKTKQPLPKRTVESQNSPQISKQTPLASQRREVPEISYEEEQVNTSPPPFVQATPMPKKQATQLAPPQNKLPVPQVQTPLNRQPIQSTITPDQQIDTDCVTPAEKYPDPGTESEPPSLTEENPHQCTHPGRFSTTYRDNMSLKIVGSPKFTRISEIKPEELCPPNSLSDLPFEELDPKNYKQLPPTFTKRIPAAGKLSYKSLSAYSVIFPES
ncbi:unnamed protein product [Blepharisma stoltei]|uniref:Uncharacterized protein n=1 Tax=Blepharisma stoltei TaxID=1481888 RepID=A0AAU9KG13_9CILI|nr:unnamed protein product [Blepharisma stoltei]